MAVIESERKAVFHCTCILRPIRRSCMLCYPTCSHNHPPPPRKNGRGHYHILRFYVVLKPAEVLVCFNLNYVIIVKFEFSQDEFVEKI